MTFDEFKTANQRFDQHRQSYQAWVGDYDTLCEQAVGFGRAGVRELAPKLFMRATDERNLFAAFEHIRKYGGSTPEPDNETCHDYREQPAKWEYVRWLRKLLRGDVAGEQYAHGETRVVRPPKKSGRGRRTIHVHNLIDRVVQRGLAQVIGPLLDLQFDPGSVAYRTGLTCCHALVQAEHHFCDGRPIFVAEDIRDAFDNVPQGRFLQILRRYLPSPTTGQHVESNREDVGRLFELIEKVVLTPKRMGARQGGPFSPLILNVYLHHFLDKPWRAAGNVPLIRYADDILLMCATTDEAKLAREALRKKIADAGMELKEDGHGDTMHDLAAGERFVWLGFEISADRGSMSVRLKTDWREELAEKLDEQGTSEPDWSFLLQWIQQMGPAYMSQDHFEVYDWLDEAAAERGLKGFPSVDKFEQGWSAGHRHWKEVRRRFAVESSAVEPVIDPLDEIRDIHPS